MKKIRVSRFAETTKLPTRKNPSDAGLDLYSNNNNFYLLPGRLAIVHTGIKVEIPHGYFGWITNKSSKDYLIGGGIIDNGYQGELLVKVINPSRNNILISKGLSVAQLLILPCEILEVEEVPEKELFRTISERATDGGIVRQLELPISNDDSFNYEDDTNLYGDS